jgi:hypothetical protein
MGSATLDSYLRCLYKIRAKCRAIFVSKTVDGHSDSYRMDLAKQFLCFWLIREGDRLLLHWLMGRSTVKHG